MNKVERDKLREFDIASLADLLPAERSWGEHISPAMMAEIIAPFLDHIDALEQQIGTRIKVIADKDELIREALLPSHARRYDLRPKFSFEILADAIALTAPLPEKNG